MEAAWRKYRDTGSQQHYANFKRLQNKVVSMIRGDKNDYQHRLVLSFKANQKKFYGYVRSKQTVKTKVSRLRKQDGNLTATDEETAATLCEQFSSVFVREPDTCLDVNRMADNIPVQFDEQTVLKKLLALKADKSPGPDLIHPLFLNKTASVLAKPISILFSRSFEEWKLPSDWKLAIISPIFKKGDKAKPENYRPVSLTSVLCKTMESIIRDEVVKYLQNEGLVSESQHGFMRGRSCLTNLLETFEAWKKEEGRRFWSGCNLFGLSEGIRYCTAPEINMEIKQCRHHG